MSEGTEVKRYDSPFTRVARNGRDVRFLGRFPSTKVNDSYLVEMEGREYVLKMGRVTAEYPGVLTRKILKKEIRVMERMEEDIEKNPFWSGYEEVDDVIVAIYTMPTTEEDIEGVLRINGLTDEGSLKRTVELFSQE